MTEYEALVKAVKIVHGQSALAKALTKRMKREHRPIRQGHVWKWLNISKRLPELYVLHVEAITAEHGDKVPACELCPALFENKAA